MSRTVTIKDIAEVCGVSNATVSRALSGSAIVKSATQRRIVDCAKELGYSFNTQKQASPAKIMIISGDISNQFYVGIIKGANTLLTQEGYKAACFYSDYSPTVEEDYVRFAFEDNYAGILMITASETEALSNLLSHSNCPIVLVNRYIRSMDLDVVCIDNHRGGYLATSYLINAGHTKIAHLTGPQNSTASQDRLIGFRAAMADAGLECPDKAIYPGDLMKTSGIRFAEYYMENLRDYTAVFCANDICAAGLLETLGKHNIHVPDDLSIICFDDSTAAVSGTVELTSVSRDPYTMGTAAAELMLEALKSKCHLPRKLVFPPVLQERNSVKFLKNPDAS